jgi:hypothetical protein
MPSKMPQIFLPLDFSQLFDLARQLPKDERRQLADMLLQEDAPAGIPEAHKQLVRARIKKYNEHPELLIDEDRAMELINNI